MARTDKILGLCIIRNGRKNGMRAICGADSRSYPASGLDRYGETGLESGAVFFNHQWKTQLIQHIRRERKANESAPMSCHEIDGSRCYLFGSHTQVALVFAIFIIHPG